MKQFPWKAVAVGGAVVGTAGVIALVVGRRSVPVGRVALIGDSYAVGLGPELAKLLPGFRYEGHVGMSTLGWLSCNACGNWLPTFAPDVVLVSLGVNDGTAPISSNYQSVVQRLHGIGARVVWIEPPAAVNAPSARAVIESLGVQIVPAQVLPMASDQLHPTGAGYQIWAQEIAQVVRA